jgi:hypothetical protein
MEIGSMKSPAVRYSTLAAVLTVALGIRVHAATTPSTPPETPAAPAVERTYPSVLPLTLEVSADKAHELGTLRDFTITAQREGDYAPMMVLAPVAPFTDENTCTRPMPAGLAGCVVNADATIGTLRVNWQVPDAGTYRFVLSGRRGASDRVVTIGAFDLEARD